MNAKQAKRARQFFRDIAVDPAEKVYVTPPKNVKITKRLGPDGKMVNEKFYYTGTITLEKDCGRAQYLSLKRDIIRSNRLGERSGR